MRMLLPIALSLSLLLGCGSPAEETAEDPAQEADYFAYFGTYTRDGDSQGIYVSRFNSETGELSEPELAAQIENPSFLAFHPDKALLYAVSETSDGTVSSFSIDEESGQLTLINTVTTRGGAPCDLEVDHTGNMLVVANYSTGSVASYTIGDDGSLSEPSDFEEHKGSSTHERQKSPHAHSVDFSDDNKFVIISDLGTDKVMIYRANPEEGALEPADPAFAQTPPGSGPRHFVFHPSNRYSYTVNELASTVTAFTYDAETGAMKEIDTVSTLPEDFEGTNHTAEIEVHPTGNFLYASNRGHDSIAVFSVNPETGSLERIETVGTQGQTPRNFAVDPSGKWLLTANQNTDDVYVYSIDPERGTLMPTGDSINVGAPVCIKYRPTA